MKFSELTWQDINTLERIINNVHYEFRNGIGEKSFGEEVLNRFLETKDEGSSEKPNNHLEQIVCPECGTIQTAKVEHTAPFYSYVHTCEKCGYTILESEWEHPNNHEGLDEAAEKYFIKVPCSEEVKKTLIEIYKPGIDAFKTGAKWDREQMMKEAVEGWVYDFRRIKEIGYSSAKIEFDKIPELDDGDKVRIIVCKNEDKK